MCCASQHTAKGRPEESSSLFSLPLSLFFRRRKLKLFRGTFTNASRERQLLRRWLGCKAEAKRRKKRKSAWSLQPDGSRFRTIFEHFDHLRRITTILSCRVRWIFNEQLGSGFFLFKQFRTFQKLSKTNGQAKRNRLWIERKCFVVGWEKLHKTIRRK